MSTSWNLYCTKHKDAPAWLDDDWSGTGDGAGRQIAALWNMRGDLHALADHFGDRLTGELEFDGHRRVTPPMIAWSREHNGCLVILRNEYGDRRGLDFEPLPPRHCKSCHCAPLPINGNRWAGGVVNTPLQAALIEFFAHIPSLPHVVVRATGVQLSLLTVRQQLEKEIGAALVPRVPNGRGELVLCPQADKVYADYHPAPPATLEDITGLLPKRTNGGELRCD